VPTGPINIIHDIFNDNDSVNIDPLKMTVNNRTRFSLQRFNIFFMAYKCLPVIILLLMIVIGILSAFIAIYTNQIQRLNELYRKRESENNNRISAFQFLISEYENNNTRLNKQLVELEENESKIYIYIYIY
jgi:predicted PurR-regulated permease PerM